MQAKGNLAELVRRHIEGLGLSLPRLYRLNRFARNTAVELRSVGKLLRRNLRLVDK
jgi:hypothetical protein